MCFQGVCLGVGKDCICKYIIIIINKKKKHRLSVLSLGLCVSNKDRRVIG